MFSVITQKCIVAARKFCICFYRPSETAANLQEDGTCERQHYLLLLGPFPICPSGSHYRELALFTGRECVDASGAELAGRKKKKRGEHGELLFIWFPKIKTKFCSDS